MPGGSFIGRYRVHQTWTRAGGPVWATATLLLQYRKLRALFALFDCYKIGACLNRL
jgi:hypothetical protein